MDKFDITSTQSNYPKKEYKATKNTYGIGMTEAERCELNNQLKLT